MLQHDIAATSAETAVEIFIVAVVVGEEKGLALLYKVLKGQLCFHDEAGSRRDEFALAHGMTCFPSLLQFTFKNAMYVGNVMKYVS